MKKSRILTLVIAFVLIVSSFTAYAGEGADDAGKTVTVGTMMANTSMDHMATPGGIAFELVFEGLYDVDPDTNEIVPRIAAEMPEQVDDVTYRIKLKENVTFSDGTPLTAEDILYSYRRMGSDNCKEKATYSIFDFDNCVAEDDHTVVLKTFEPNGNVMNAIAA